MPTPIHFTHNGQPVSAFADDGESLLDMLRRKLGDMTPKYGCVASVLPDAGRNGFRCRGPNTGRWCRRKALSLATGLY